MDFATLPYPALDNLTEAEQRELWERCLKQVDALTLEAYINATAEPENAAERLLYERRLKHQRNLRRAHQEWADSPTEE